MKKSTFLRSLILCGLSMCLCISMLAGSTFAWFTDEVKSGNNIIMAGNLDVELTHTNKTVTDETVAGATNLFSDIDAKKWEPNAMAMETFTVKNLGNLALKYELSLNVSDVTTGKDGTSFATALMVAVVNGTVAGRAAAEAIAESEWKTLESISKVGDLMPTENGVTDEDVWTVIIWWKPSDNDNNFNMNNGATDEMSATIGVRLFATQVEAEDDSFGNDYDKNAAVFTVDEANAQLAEGLDVTLMNCNDPNGVLLVPAGYTGTLTLCNSNIASIQESASTATVALDEVGTEATAPVVAATKIVIMGNVVVKATEDGMSAITGTKLEISGNGKLTAIGNGTTAFGIGGMTTESISIKDITIGYVEGGYAYGVGTDTKYYKDAPEGGAAIGSGKDGATITLENVTVEKAVGGSKAAAIGARYHIGVTVNITDSTIKYAEGGVSAAAIGGSRVSNGATESGTIINITNSTVTAMGGAYGAGIGSGYDTHCQANQPLCTINIDGSTINATGGKYAAGVGSGYHNAALTGEIKNSTVNAVSGEKVYKAEYSTAMDIGFGVVDPNREGQQTGSLTYNGVALTYKDAPEGANNNDTLKDALKNDATVVLSAGNYNLPTLADKEGVTIIGAADGSTVIGGESTSTGFGSNFGKNTTIKNVTFSGTTNGVRSSYAKGGNTTFENCVFEGGSTYGFHIDQSNAATFTFNNCTFIGFNAFAGDLVKVVFNNCTFLHNGNYGHTNIWSVAEFNNCTFGDKASVGTRGDNAHIFFNGVEESYHHEYVGSAESLFAFAESVNVGKDTWNGQAVILVADIDLENALWTPIGQTGATQFQGTFDGHGYTISNLNVNSLSQTGAHYSSGLFGWLNNATVKNVTVENATVSGNHNVGVIAGYMETAGCTISNCHVINATVVAKHANGDACGDKVGVIVGHAGNAGVKVENCSATDCTVTAGRDAGQIAGAALTANVTGCTATNVTVTAGGDCSKEANITNDIIGRVLG